jgi:hypothetical protein
LTGYMFGTSVLDFIHLRLVPFTKPLYVIVAEIELHAFFLVPSCSGPSYQYM